jgi:hypothetical protein
VAQERLPSRPFFVLGQRTCCANARLAREVRDFHSSVTILSFARKIDFPRSMLRKAAPGAESTRTLSQVCTISGHGAVNGVHSTENMCTYKRVFSVDEKNRRSKTTLFFDSFLSFSGWCGVRGSSEVTF